MIAKLIPIKTCSYNRLQVQEVQTHQGGTFSGVENHNQFVKKKNNNQMTKNK